MKTCVWTGQPFTPLTRGGNEKIFISAQAKTEAHKAARIYTEAMIEQGLMTWEDLREWYETYNKGGNSVGVSCTARKPRKVSNG